MTARVIKAADLFCGAGGTSTGLARACAALGYGLELVAVNHWDVAIETHRGNHPWATHLCSDLDKVNPREAVPGGRLNLMVASPECTHHSNARGGKPVTDQRRASAWHVLRWAEALHVSNILIENVREFREWGPIGANGRPMKSKRGHTYQAFLQALRSLGYRVEDRILNAADFGDPTTRERLFIMARRGNQSIRWPEPSHSKHADLFGKEKWRAAREVIDWSVPGKSIFGRKHPLAPATLARIAEGLRRFGGDAAGPFLLLLTHGGRAHSIDEPVPTVTCANRGELGVVTPFVLQQQSGGVARSVSDPLPTVATKGAIALVEPFLVPFYGERKGQPPRTHDVGDPVPTIPASGSGKFALCEPFIVGAGGPRRKARSLDDPMQTILTREDRALVQPFLLINRNNNVPKSLDQPVPTICTGGHMALVQPFLTKFYGTGKAQSVEKPCPTLTAKDRLGLVTGDDAQGVLDIHFRMLQPHELARAMSFGDDYTFAGNREDRVRQIGNAVPVRLAQALCGALIEGRTKKEDAA